MRRKEGYREQEEVNMKEIRKVQVYDYVHCPFCGEAEITLSEESFNYKAGFWGGIFLHLLGALLFGLLCRKRIICHCHNCGSKFSYYEEERA